MNIEKVKLNLLFETSWEVCNKIGGIYTVLSTKAKTLQKLYKDKTIFVGPDVWTAENPSPSFIEDASLLQSWRESVALPMGITARVGRWDVPGKPIAILVGFNTMYAYNDELFGKMWELYGVDSIHAYGDYGEACAFSHAAAIVIESICNHIGTANKKIIAHFDEWTTGMGLLYIKWKLPTVATIFTTHATSIGRSICGNNKPLYDYLKGYNGDQMAQELNMEAKHSLEKAAAHAADCFTTVSDITAIECEQLLDIKPAVVTPNGFEQNFVPSKTRFESTRKKARKTLLNTASALTGKRFDDDTFIVATSGRCEYRNKGLDVFLDSINTLRSRDLHRNILAYILVPAWVNSPREDLRNAIDKKRSVRLDDPVVSHNLNEPWNDAVLNRIHGLNFQNLAEENITLIYVPCYLNGNDGIFNTPYYDILIGMDATVFPSYYEPWGYTPLESVAFGVPTVTTSLSGFGQWILASSENDFAKSGVNVIARNDSNYHQVTQSIAESLMALINATEAQREEISAAAHATADAAAWSSFIEYYLEAFTIAFKNTHQHNI
jgi:glycosyltransferase involved in cell wall biosynthesis